MSFKDPESLSIDDRINEVFEEISTEKEKQETPEDAEVEEPTEQLEEEELEEDEETEVEEDLDEEADVEVDEDSSDENDEEEEQDESDEDEEEEKEQEEDKKGSKFAKLLRKREGKLRDKEFELKEKLAELEAKESKVKELESKFSEEKIQKVSKLSELYESVFHKGDSSKSGEFFKMLGYDEKDVLSLYGYKDPEETLRAKREAERRKEIEEIKRKELETQNELYLSRINSSVARKSGSYDNLGIFSPEELEESVNSYVFKLASKKPELLNSMQASEIADLVLNTLDEHWGQKLEKVKGKDRNKIRSEQSEKSSSGKSDKSKKKNDSKNSKSESKSNKAKSISKAKPSSSKKSSKKKPKVEEFDPKKHNSFAEYMNEVTNNF